MSEIVETRLLPSCLLVDVLCMVQGDADLCMDMCRVDKLSGEATCGTLVKNTALQLFWATRLLLLGITCTLENLPSPSEISGHLPYSSEQCSALSCMRSF